MSKLDQLMELIESLTPLDYAMASRGQLEDLGMATFDVGGECDVELESRGASAPYLPGMLRH